MARGISIHIGVNKLDPTFYKHTSFKDLKSCINDANEMKKLAEEKHFEALPVLENAKKDEVKTLIKDVAKNQLVPGDICLITFSGHGGQIRDANRDERFDKFFLDETWCLSDRPMSDDEILDLWTDFKEGVRILIISDSCHSGGIIDLFRLGITNPIRSQLLAKGFDFRGFESQLLYENGLKSIEINQATWDTNAQILNELNISESVRTALSTKTRDSTEQEAKMIPREILERLTEESMEFKEEKFAARESLLNKLDATDLNHVQELKKASLILLSACEAWQGTKDGTSETDNGDFTKALLQVWREANGEFTKGYQDFRTAIHNKLKSMNKTQSPKCFPTGAINDQFLNQLPLTI